MSALGGRIRLHRDDRARLEPHLPGGALRYVFGRLVATAAPRHDRSPDLEQGRRVLDDDLERCQCPRGHEVERVALRRQGLRAGMNDPRVRDRERSHGPLEEGALAARAFHERDAGARQGNRQRQAGETGTAPEVRRLSRATDDVELESDQRVGQVVFDHLERIPHRGGSQWILDQEVMQLAELAHRALAQAMDLRQRLQGRLDLR